MENPSGVIAESTTPSTSMEHWAENDTSNELFQIEVLKQNNYGK